MADDANDETGNVAPEPQTEPEAAAPREAVTENGAAKHTKAESVSTSAQSVQKSRIAKPKANKKARKLCWKDGRLDVCK